MILNRRLVSKTGLTLIHVTFTKQFLKVIISLLIKINGTRRTNGYSIVKKKISVKFYDLRRVPKDYDGVIIDLAQNPENHVDKILVYFYERNLWNSNMVP